MEIFIGVMVFLFGICLGSFFCCIGYRIPNKISTVRPGSFCPNCKEPLKWYMNIPLFSFIFLKGKCYFCKEKISMMYFVIELLGGILFLASYIYFGITKEFFVSIVLVSMLLVTIVTDFKYFYISDRVLVVGTLLILGIYIYYINFKDILFYVASAIIMFLLMWLIKILGDKAFKKESLGGGDIKLMVPIGLSLGLINAVTSLLISSSLALIVSLVLLRKSNENIVPFGPFLLIGTIVMFLLEFNGISLI